MSSVRTIPLLLSVLIGLLLGLLAWGAVRVGHQTAQSTVSVVREDVLVGLLALGVFSLGAILTYVLLVGWA
jgi:hypothetical protein